MHDDNGKHLSTKGVDDFIVDPIIPDNRSLVNFFICSCLVTNNSPISESSQFSTQPKMEGSTIQDWKLYRQFQKTLESLSSPEKHEETWLLNEKFNDILEITSIEDEGEQLGGQDNYLLEEFNEKFDLKTYFERWKDSVEVSANKRRKSEFYYRFNTLERGFKNWKTFTRQSKQKRLVEMRNGMTRAETRLGINKLK